MIRFNLCDEMISGQITRQIPFNTSLSKVLFSCFSYNKTYLAVLNESYQLVLYYLYRNRQIFMEINEEPCFVYPFPRKTTCCNISQNEEYIAVGTETGEIFVSLFYDYLAN